MNATEAHIAAIIHLRRARAEVLGEGLFGDIGWDILLELFAAYLGGRSIRLSDLECQGPRSTVARWAAALEERGLIRCRRSDRFDRDELWLELSDLGRTKLEGLFDQARCEARLVP